MNRAAIGTGKRIARMARRPLAAALLLFSVGPTPFALAGDAPRSSQDLTLSEFMRCPEPPSDSILTLEPTGAAKIVVLRGMDPKRARTLTNYKQLTRAEMDELAALLRAEKFDRIPEVPPDPARPPSLSHHSCLITIEIQLDGKTARLRYDSDPDTASPAKALGRKIGAILQRHEWRETAP